MRIIFAGTPAAAVPALEHLVQSEHEVVAVLSQPAARRGRGRQLALSPVAQAAQKHGIPVLDPPTLRDFETQERILATRAQGAAVVAYGNLIPASLLSGLKHGWINLHFSLLPAWRGAAPVQRAIAAGDTTSGASVFQLEAGLDTGPVYATFTEAIHPNDTAGELLTRLANMGANMLVETLTALEAGTAQAQPQSPEGITLAPKITVEEAEIDWTAPADVIGRRIRAYTPAPGAWTTFRNNRIKIGPLVPASLDDSACGAPPVWPKEASGLSPGELYIQKHAIWIGTGSHPVQLQDLAPAGKQNMAAPAWARGIRPEPAERFAAVATAEEGNDD